MLWAASAPGCYLEESPEVPEAEEPEAEDVGAPVPVAEDPDHRGVVAIVEEVRRADEEAVQAEAQVDARRAALEAEAAAHAEANAAVGRTDESQYITEEFLQELEAEMHAAAEALEFERAAAIRDRIDAMRDSVGKTVAQVERVTESRGRRGARGRRRGKGRVPRPKKNP